MQKIKSQKIKRRRIKLAGYILIVTSKNYML